MKTTNSGNDKRHLSAKARMVPALTMLLTSAVMLSTSTYAWFTMNREAEVTGLQMTATTAEGLEISLGSVDSSNKVITTGTTPADDDISWSNAVAVSDYYNSIGKIYPASSVNGSSLFYTNSAEKNGTASSTATFTAVSSTNVAKLTVGTYKDATATIAADSTGKGYYIDIPVYLRTKKEAASDENICAVIKISTGNSDNLYKAVRVAVMDSAASSGTVFGADAEHFENDNGSPAKPLAVSAKNADNTATRAATVINKGDGSAIVVTGVKLNKSVAASSDYRMQSFIVRVWLEGESKSCKDDNSGQSWNIDMKFGLTSSDGRDSGMAIYS